MCSIYPSSHIAQVCRREKARYVLILDRELPLAKFELEKGLLTKSFSLDTCKTLNLRSTSHVKVVGVE